MFEAFQKQLSDQKKEFDQFKKTVQEEGARLKTVRKEDLKRVELNEKKLALFQLKMDQFKREIAAERRAARKGRLETKKGFRANANNFAAMFAQLQKVLISCIDHR